MALHHPYSLDFPQPGLPRRGLTATLAMMKGGREEACGREAAVREPGTFDVQSPGPADCISGFSARAGSQPRYQEQTSR